MRNKMFFNAIVAVLMLLPVSSALANDTMNQNITGTFVVQAGNISVEVGENNFDFGKIEISDITQSAITRTTKLPSITVIDNKGELNGWSLMVSSTKFKESYGDHELKSGSLLIDTTGATKETNGQVSVNEVGAIDNGTQTILVAERGNGYGINTIDFKDNSLILNIDQKDVRASEYTATVTYTLAPELGG